MVNFCVKQICFFEKKNTFKENLNFLSVQSCKFYLHPDLSKKVLTTLGVFNYNISHGTFLAEILYVTFLIVLLENE